MQNSNPHSHSQPPQPSPPPPPPSPPSTPSLFSTFLKDPKTVISIILATSLFSLFFFLTISSSSLSSFSSSSSSSRSRLDPYLFPSHQTHHHIIFHNNPLDPTPPSIAYLISGSDGDSGRILRLLLATYHPRNHYLLHLDRLASQAERDRLALSVQSIPVFKAAQNVNVMGKADFIYPKGSSPISFTLHGASVLLRLSPNWDWFISLNAGDYPLVTQDDLLHILSYLPKDINFVKHSSYVGWRESKKLKPIIVDPGLYLSEKTPIFHVTQKREYPTAYQLFTGTSFNILSRNFVEFCILGTDNLPRTLLMYFSNTPAALSNYFPTILCNSHQFNRTIINHNLRFADFDKHKHSTMEPRQLSSKDFDTMIGSGAAFASQFSINDPVLDQIDRKILRRGQGSTVPGGWCLGEFGNNTCVVWGDADVLRPGQGSRRLEKLLVKLLSDGKFRTRRCIVE